MSNLQEDLNLNNNENNNNNENYELETKRRKLEEEQLEISQQQQQQPQNNTQNNTQQSSSSSSSSNHGNDTRARAQRYLQLMNSEQIMQVLLDIAESIPEALEKLEEKAQSDPAHRKLFIRGLAWDTTDEQLHAAFNVYGEIEDAAVVMDRTTGKNKGYGFVIFKDMDSAYAALQEPEKEIDGRKTHCNLASLGGQGQTRTRSGSFGNTAAAMAATPYQPPQPEEEIYGTRSIEYRKLFIRGLDYNTTVDELKIIFSEYGEIEECVIPTERSTGKSKGFAFLTFKQASSATDALHHPVRDIGGRTVNIHLATQTNPHRASGPGGGGGGGGPMGMGYMGVPQMPNPGFMGPPQGGIPPGGYMGPDTGYYGGPRGMVPPGRYQYPPGQGVW